jgi:hypothetical protein
MESTAILVLLLGLGGGDRPTDIVSALPAEAYFQARRVPINVDNMIYLAAKDPEDGAAQIKQLLALRVLADRPEEIKKSKSADEIRKTLEKVAKGELAKDAQGFSMRYAAAALARLKGDTVKLAPAKPGKLREDALGWFPDSLTFAAAVDLSPAEGGYKMAEVAANFWKLVPEREHAQIFNVVEMLGNIRFDRVAFGFTAAADRKGEIYIRLSGKANPRRVIEGLKTLSRSDLQVATVKDVIYFQDRDRPPAMAILGDSDLIMCGFERDRGANHRDLVDKVLAVRAGKQGSVLKGNLKDALGKLSDKASGLMAGDLPDELRRDVMRGFLGTFPRSIRGEMFRTKDGMDLHLTGTLGSADDAKAFTQGVTALKQSGLQGLNNPPREIPAEAIAALRKTLESLQVVAKESTVEVRILVPMDAVTHLPAMMFLR